MSADLDDLHAATHNLHQLLAVICDLASEVHDPEMGDHSRTVATRLDAVAAIARREAARIDAAVGEKIDADNLYRSTEVATIRTLGEEYEEYYAAWIAAAEAADIPNASEELKQAEKDAEDRHDHWRDALFTFHSPVPEAMAEKASILLRVCDNAEGMNDNRIVQLMKSMGGAS